MSERDDLTEQAFHAPMIIPAKVVREDPGSYCCGHPDNVHSHEDEEDSVEQRPYPLRLDLEDGKYTLILHVGGIVTADRHGEPWRDFVGDKFMVNLARHVFGLGENE